MKYLEALEEAGKKETKSVPTIENKMQKGTRLDQNDPQSLVSSLRGDAAPTDPKNKKKTDEPETETGK